jgi:Ala-tRNA(Pro) deacylase
MKAGLSVCASVFERIEELLTRNDADFSVMRHAPVFTSEEAAQVRGAALCSGAKALICKCDSAFVMFILPADKRLASKRLREVGGWRKSRFATREEVAALTGLTPGSIPPFGSLFGIPTYCDQALAENERINFNAGDHAISVNLLYRDYLRVEQPVMASLAE